jgi:stromal membrane-associated protein
MASITKQPKEVQERHRAMLLELLKQPGNRECADCRGRNPTWASTNLGIFVCIRCSGLHRQVGTHVTKVKSCTMDLWDPEQIAFMARMGNARARLVWEAQLSADYGKPSESERDDMVLEWIRAKYERKRYMAMDPEAVLRAAGPAPSAGSTTKRATGGPLRTRTAGGGPTSTAAPVESPAPSASGFSFTQAATAPAGVVSAFSFVASGPTSPSSSTTPGPASPPPSFASPQTGFDFGAGGFNFGAPAADGFTDAPAAGGFDFALAASNGQGFAFTGAPASAPVTTASGTHVLDSLFKAAPGSAVDVFGMPAPATASSSAHAVAPREAPLGFMVGTATEVPAAAVPTASAPPTFPAPVKADPFAVLAQPFESPSHAPAPFSTPASSFASPAAALEPSAAAPIAAPLAVPAAAPSGAAEDTAAMQRMLEQLQAQQALLMQQMHQLQLQSA